MPDPKETCDEARIRSRSVDVPGTAKSDKPADDEDAPPRTRREPRSASDLRRERAEKRKRAEDAKRYPLSLDLGGWRGFQGDTAHRVPTRRTMISTKMISTRMAATTTWPDDDERSAPRAPHDEDRPHDDDDEVSHVEEADVEHEDEGPAWSQAGRAPRLPGGRSRDQRSQCPAAPAAVCSRPKDDDPHWRPSRRGLARSGPACCIACTPSKSSCKPASI